MSAPARIAVVGAAGYVGGELAKLLADHPRAEVAVHASRAAAGKPVAQVLPDLRGKTRAVFAAPDPGQLAECDIVFFAAPHGAAMEAVPPLLKRGATVIDLGPDFRLRDPALYEKYYGRPHSAPDLLPSAVFGIPEAPSVRRALPSANLVACPGCHSTAAILALLPFAESGALNPEAVVVADSKTGTSGAGRRADRPDLALAEMHANCKPYAVAGHRHRPEIAQALSEFAKIKTPPALAFVPHLLPLSRGILSSAYLQMKVPYGALDLTKIAAKYFGDAPFVDILPPDDDDGGLVPELSRVAFSNRVEIMARPLVDETALVSVALDNLMKGAAGQAIQNMNLRLNFPETEGLPGAFRRSGVEPFNTRPDAPASGRMIPPLQRRAKLRRSGVEPPTGTIHPRKVSENKGTFRRSGVKPPTGTIHPRKVSENNSGDGLSGVGRKGV